MKINEYLLRRVLFCSAGSNDEMTRILETLELLVELKIIKKEYLPEINQILYDHGY